MSCFQDSGFSFLGLASLKMSWLRKFPWLSLSLVLLSYSIFGWYVAQSSVWWSHWLVEQGKSWGWFLEQEAASGIIQLLGAALIGLISVALTTPVALITMFFGSGLKSDMRAFVSMLGWAFASVLIIRWFHYFAHFLVLLCSAILGRLDLQGAGYNQWQIFFILTGFCLGSFGLGVLAFTMYG